MDGCLPHQVHEGHSSYLARRYCTQDMCLQTIGPGCEALMFSPYTNIETLVCEASQGHRSEIDRAAMVKDRCCTVSAGVNGIVNHIWLAKKHIIAVMTAATED